MALSHIARGKLLRLLPGLGAVSLLMVVAAPGCASDARPAPEAPQSAVGPKPDSTSPPPVAGADGGEAGSAVSTQPEAGPPAACPAGMVHVKKDYCPKMERHCLKNEYDKSNHISICHRFKEGAQKCKAKRFPLDYCIDVYEYPNKKGARPPVMVDWYDAMGLCAAKGKRLCYEAEWVAACARN